MERIFVFLFSSLLILMVLIFLNWLHKQSDYYKIALCERLGGVVMVDKYFNIHCEYKNDN